MCICGNLACMWCLDPVNSPGLIERLRPHGRDRDFEVGWVGEGWRSLVDECHTRIVAVFHEYELVNIKQKYGELIYQAYPRRVVGAERPRRVQRQGPRGRD